MKRTKLLDRATQTPPPMAHMHSWKFSVLTAAAVALTGFYAGEASALALGRVTVQSALGEPLRAEIDLPQITSAEADSLRATTASPEVFRAQGMEFNPTVNNLRIQLQRRADGTAVLSLFSDRPVNEPFVDLVLDATWSSGHIVRSYTMLFDPPALRRPAPAVAAAPQVSAPAARAQTSQEGSSPVMSRAAAPSAPRAPRKTGTASPRPSNTNGVTVKAGDTASRLANAYRPASVSLDQMLVSLMRTNPDAFIGGNVNRIKAGAVLQIPDEATALATPAGEARQILAAQSGDFNAFRRKLAAAAPTTKLAAAERFATGTVQTRIEDKKPATTAPDKLTLSKGAITGQTEDQLARGKQADESWARMAELSKNINELNKLSAASAPIDGPTGTASSAPGAIAVAAPAASESAAVAASPAASVASAVEAVASAPAVPTEATSPTSTPAPATAPKPAPLPSQNTESSFLSDLVEDPLVPAGGLLVLIALGAYGAYRVLAQRRRANPGVDSSFLESRLQPDSFFGASGGQRVDTANSETVTDSSMAYSPSQLDAGEDVDPVAEADVYLAYGRDLQAEEILKEALRNNPARISVHVKLADIYAKRQDRKALEAVAGDVFKLTQGEGPDWAHVSELGRALDQGNSLYQPSAHPGIPDADAPATPSASLSSPLIAAAPAAAALPPEMDIDLDLDLPEDALSDAPALASGFAAAAAAAATADESHRADTIEPAALAQIDLPTSLPPEQPPLEAPAAIVPPPVEDLDFPTADDLTMLPSGAMPLTSSNMTEPLDSAPMEFDLGDLSLDLDMPSIASTPAMSPASAPVTADSGVDAAANDPLATKLALAQEFDAIGDTDGARTLIEEVIAESSGALKARAQQMLADLG